MAKAIAEAGISSRRKAEELIRGGLIKVNGVVVTEPKTTVDPEIDRIEVANESLNIEKKIYILLNKPAGYISSVTDTHGRKTVLDLLTDVKERVFPVGRLDMDTEGLILLTNDGEFANLMTHPRYHVPKVYKAMVKGSLKLDEIKKLEQGILLDGKTTAPARLKILRLEGGNTWLELELHEGRKRQVKLMMAEVGHPVLRLERIRFAFLELKGLQRGKYRRLLPEEIQRLRTEVFKEEES
ncbi:MAG: pseudouridine synthase [Ignavibacteriales bacterium]